MHIFIALLISAFILEVGCGLLYRLYWFKANKQVDPHYTNSFYTQNGKKIGSKNGILKLLYQPQIGYINYPDQRTTHFTINSHGFRNAEVQKRKNGKKRIIIVGGSTAFGTGLNSNHETFAYQLERMLVDTEVINAAVIGHRSGQELTYIVTKLIDFEPDLIIAFDGGNDYWQIGFAYDRSFDVNGGLQYEEELEILDALIYSNIFTRIINLPRILFARIKTMSEILFNMTFDSINAALNKNKELKNRIKKILKSIGLMKTGGLTIDVLSTKYIQNIKKMDKVAKAYNANFLCVLQPVEDFIMNRQKIPEYTDGWWEFRSIVKQQFDQFDIKHLDLNDYIVKILPEMFMDGVHLDRRGNRVMAEIVASTITEKKYLKINPNS